MKWWLVAISAIVAGCGVSRFESIDTCEFEQWEVFGIAMWKGSDCKGSKDEDTMLHKTIDNTRDIKNAD